MNLDPRNYKSNRIKWQNRASTTNDDEFCIKGKSKIDYKAHGVKSHPLYNSNMGAAARRPSISRASLVQSGESIARRASW